MVYIVVLNWNGAKDTIHCVQSLLRMKYDKFRIIIVDNKSTDDSFSVLKSEVLEQSKTGIVISIIDFENVDKCKIKNNEKIILFQSDKNRGYAGGNNLGIKLALNQRDMKYVWVINNDTEVDEMALTYLVNKCDLHPEIGICGARLVDFYDRKKQQGLGGLHNKWLCTTKQYGIGHSIHQKYNDDIICKEIDYVIGAAMLLTKQLLDSVGLMHEDYFLYYEELDICLRAKDEGFSLGVCSDSIVFHKEGASTGGGRSALADYCSIRNRLLVTAKFYPAYIPFVWFSLFGVAVNRVKRRDFKKMIICFGIMFGFKWDVNKNAKK